MNAMPYFAPMPPCAGDTVRRAMTEASKDLKKRGSLATMVSALLFCLIVTFAWFTAFLLLALVVGHAATGASPTLLMGLEVGIFAVGVVLFITLVAPVWLGRLRLSGLICTGRMPQVKEVLYYYTTLRRLGRAVLIALVIVLQILLPVSLIAGGSVFLLWLYNEVLIFVMADGLAIMLLIFAFLVLLVLFVGTILLSGVWTIFAAVAVGNDKMPVFCALGLAWRVGRGHMGALALFALQSLWHLLLSAVSFGVLYLYWYSHHYLMSYLRLSMALCSEKECDLI